MNPREMVSKMEKVEKHNFFLVLMIFLLIVFTRELLKMDHYRYTCGLRAIPMKIIDGYTTNTQFILIELCHSNLRNKK